MSHRPTCGFQAVVCNTRNARDTRLETQPKNWNTQCTHAKNATHATDSILASVAFFVCVLCDILICVARTAAWKPTLSPFSYAYIRFPSCMQRTLRNGRTACDAIKKRNTQRMHAKKNTPHAINSMLCVRCVFWRFSRAYVALRTIAWKPTFKSVFCILMAAALFRRSARLHQPAIAKFLFHDRWAVCEIRRSTLVHDIIIKAPALNKWTPVSASACVVG